MVRSQELKYTSAVLEVRQQLGFLFVDSLAT